MWKSVKQKLSWINFKYRNRGYTAKMTRKMNNIICMMLAVCVHIVCTIQDQWCEQTYPSPSGLICFYCAPGTYVDQHCKSNYTKSSCKTCSKNKYQRNCNQAESCGSCDQQCKDGYKKVKNCTMYENIICECQDGYYNIPETSTDGVCLPHNTCKAGSRIVKPGNPHNDTECKECENGTFSDKENSTRCTPCTKCKINKTECTSITDAKCEVAWINTTDRPTQTTKWCTSSTVHSSTADMPTQTTECSDSFKVPIIFSAAVNGILLICVLIYASVKYKLWKKCPCCSDGCCCNHDGNTPSRRQNTDGNTPSRRQNTGVNTSPQGQNRGSGKISQEQGSSPQGHSTGSTNMLQEQSIFRQRRSSTSNNMQNRSTNNIEDNHGESDIQPSSADPLLKGQHTQQSNLNGSNPRDSRQATNRSLQPRQPSQGNTNSDEDRDSLVNSNRPAVSVSSKNF